ncbi:MAG: pantoate--beta-alanine ligase [Gammaproteobacteria bacterium]|nr:MAG: pantoate--beta-alanine ligase [Gammaproteobacteria bacterium]
MQQLESVAELRLAIASLRQQHRRIAFVPTMGNLHAGHLRLVHEARKQADAVVASIFVNPLQFGANDDLDVYPRTPEQDSAVLEAEGVNVLFIPGVAEIYPRGLEQQTKVRVPGVSDILCGASRPGHFEGVTTVVNRLFNLVTPDIAVFGKKDYQQLKIIRLMVEDLGLPIEIIGLDTVRETDGLALSSRNQYLTQQERVVAPRFYETLQTVANLIKDGQLQRREIEIQAINILTGFGFEPDYVSVLRQQDLAAPTVSDTSLVILAAVRLGSTRLIDNLELSLVAD